MKTCVTDPDPTINTCTYITRNKTVSNATIENLAAFYQPYCLPPPSDHFLTLPFNTQLSQLETFPQLESRWPKRANLA
jgi:hypothetical protein